jgi:hypothetical protein
LQRQLRCELLLLLLPAATSSPSLTHLPCLTICPAASFRALITLTSRSLLTAFHVNLPIIVLVLIALLLPCAARLAGTRLLLLRIRLVHLLLLLRRLQLRWRSRSRQLPLLLRLPHQLGFLLLLQHCLARKPLVPQPPPLLPPLPLLLLPLLMC